MFKKISQPNLTSSDVLMTIKESFKNNVQNKLLITDELINNIMNLEKEYVNEKHSIHNLRYVDKIGKFDKSVSKYFYDTKIVEDRVGNIYSLLRNQSELCPICKASAETLDHILPKSLFIQYALTPINIVPLCNSCNWKKDEHYSFEEDKTPFHPYFDDFNLDDYLTAHYKIDSESNFIVIYSLIESTEERYKFNFNELYKLNSICSSFAHECMLGWLDSCKKNLEESSPEQLKLIMKREITDESRKRIILPPPWKRILYNLILENYDDFYKYAIENKLHD